MATSTLQNPENEFFIGFSTIEITPPLDLKVRLGGYLRFNKYAKKVIHPIYARAFCIRHKKDIYKSLIMISVDLVGGQYRWTKLVRKMIENSTGIPRSNIIIHFTHSHTSPDMIGIFPNKIGQLPRTDVQYPVLKYIMKKIMNSGINSYNNASNSFKIGFGFSEKVHPSICGQREPPYQSFNDPIRIIKITSVDEKQILALIVNYQGHPTQLPQMNSDISSEYPGLVAKHLYDNIKDIQYAAYFNGAIGDVSIHGYSGYFKYKFREYIERNGIDIEELRNDRDKYRKVLFKARKINGSLHNAAMEMATQNVEELGAKIADYVLEAHDSIKVEPLSILKINRRFVFPKIGRKKQLWPRMKYYNKFSHKLWMIKNDIENWLRITFLIKGYKFMNGRYMPMLNIQKNGRTILHQTELNLIKINDIFWFNCPGEPFILYQKALFKKIPGEKAFFNSMVNDTCGYIFPWSFYVRGGYETLFSFDMLYGEYVYGLFKEEVQKLKK